jgi:CoA:oxalate CoA-transferase
MTAALATPAPAEATALAHLAAAGVGAGGDGVAWSIAWHGPGDERPGSEATAEARAGLMALHGDAGGPPRRLALDVASAAAGILAVQGVLAARLAGGVASVETSVLAGALLFASHHVAVSTAGGEPVVRGRHPRAPPFAGRDGVWFELEAVDVRAWSGLWAALGVGPADIDAGWAAFARRYVLGACQLPETLHAATRRRPFAAIAAEAAAHGVAAIPVRAGDAGIAPWDRTPATPGPRATAVPREIPLAAARPLAGIRVVELTSRLQGPLAGRLLALLGAQVTKVEPPGGDPGRLAPAGPFRGAYRAYNHGKDFAELDYRRPAGRAELEALVAGADVFLHNARPGRAERHGFDAGRLGRVRPGLVHAQLAGWAPGAGRGDAVAGDYVVQADSGLALALSEPGGPPRPSPLTLVDVTGGLLGCEAILAALLDRERTGRGARVATSLAGAAAVLLRARGRPEEDRLVRTRDGWLAVTGATREAGAEGRSAAEWEAELTTAGVAAATVCEDVAGLAADPRIAGLLEPLGDGIVAAGAPWQFRR